MKNDDSSKPADETPDPRQLGLFTGPKTSRARARAKAIGLDAMKVPTNGVETSNEAAESIKPDAGRMRLLVLETVIERGPLTCDEVEEITGLSHQTASARVYDLRHAGRLVDSGDRRETRSGRKAIVWKAVVPSDVVTPNPNAEPAHSSATDRP